MPLTRHGAGALLPAILLLAGLTGAQAPPEPSPSMPLVMPGFASLTGFYLTEPDSDLPLTTRHIEVITLVGEVDPPFVEGDDRIDLVNPEYNELRFKQLMDADPGMVTASLTIFIEEPDPLDNRVQLWETVFVRVYNAEDKLEATHYCDTGPWKTQPGFIDLTPELIRFGEWKPIE
jgi:hypothetical protein